MPISGASVTLGNRRAPIADGENGLGYQTPPMLLTKTGDQGRFEFEDAGVGDQWLQARSEGSGLWAETVHVTDGGDLDLVIRLVPGGSIKGRVTNAAGSPCPAATVEVIAAIDGAMSRMETKADKGGNFELHGVTPGSVQFQVQDAEWNRILRAYVRVVSDQLTVWNPVLPDPKVLRGRVISESGEPLAGWMVSSRPVKDGVVARGSMGARTNLRGAYSLSPGFGQLFEISDSAPGDLQSSLLKLEAIEILDESCDLVIPDDLVPSAEVFGRVLDADGKGLRAEVHVAAGSPPSYHQTVRTQSDGTFRIDYLPGEPFEVSVVAKGLPERKLSSTSPLGENEIRDLGSIPIAN